MIHSMPFAGRQWTYRISSGERMNLRLLAKCFEDRASEIERGEHGDIGNKAERVFFMRDVAGALYQYARRLEDEGKKQGVGRETTP